MKHLSIFLVAILFSSVALAQTNFSGTWVLNPTKSKLGERTFAPKTVVIVQEGNNLTIDRTVAFGDQESTLKDKLTLDGKECTNIGMMEMEKKSIVTSTDGKKTLKIDSKVQREENILSTTEILKIVDGCLIIESSMNSSFGEIKETQAFDKKIIS